MSLIAQCYASENQPRYRPIPYDIVNTLPNVRRENKAEVVKRRWLLRLSRRISKATTGICQATRHMARHERVPDEVC